VEVGKTKVRRIREQPSVELGIDVYRRVESVADEVVEAVRVQKKTTSKSGRADRRRASSRSHGKQAVNRDGRGQVGSRTTPPGSSTSFEEREGTISIGIFWPKSEDVRT